MEIQRIILDGLSHQHGDEADVVLLISGFKVGPSRGVHMRITRKRECLWRLRGSAMHDLRVVLASEACCRAGRRLFLQNDLSISF